MTLNRTILQLCKELEEKMYDVNKQIQAKLDRLEDGVKSSDRRTTLQLEVEDLEENYDKLDTQRSDLLTIKTILDKFIDD